MSRPGPEPRGVGLSWLVDAAAATVVVVSCWLLPRQVSGAGAALAGVVAVAMLLRWRHPLACVLAAAAATAAGVALDVTTDPFLGAAWCLYPVALRRGGNRTPRTAAVGLVAAAGLAATLADGDGSTRVMIAIGALTATWLLGDAEARRAAAAQQVVAQAAEMERARAQAAMAREVHDVVGHALTVISAEAGVARSVGTPDELRESLADIESRARDALEDVQGLVRALRAGSLDDAGADSPAAALPRLVAAAQASGLSVTARLDVPSAPPQSGRAAVRVVQEALSNVVRHSGATRCDVAVFPDGDRLTVRVDDDGRGLPAAPRDGTGLTGMRERVTAAGGELTVTDRRGGGTRVLARLPLVARP